MKVLVADKFEKSGIDGLTAIGCEVLNQPDLVDQALVDAIASLQPAVIVVRSTNFKGWQRGLAPNMAVVWTDEDLGHRGHREERHVALCLR